MDSDIEGSSQAWIPVWQHESRGKWWLGVLNVIQQRRNQSLNGRCQRGEQREDSH